jgi:hypothetical protein
MKRRRIVAIVILVFGCALIAAGLSIRSGAMRGVDWPKTTAKVLERKVEHRSRNVGYPVVRYRYSVEGKDYESDNVYAIGKVSKNMDESQKWVDSLPESIEVHYNPARPGEAYILSTPSVWFWIPLGIGALVVLVGLVRLLSGGKA